MERGCVQCRWERGREGQERLESETPCIVRWYSTAVYWETCTYVSTTPIIGRGESLYSYTMITSYFRGTRFLRIFLSE